jgi:hypothetical protein
MKKMEIRQTKMSGRVRRANCGRSANSSERLGDRLVRRRPGMRLITLYNLPLNNCLICLKPLDSVKPYQAIWILMRGPYQIWTGAFFFTSSRLVSTPATSAREIQLFPCKGQRDGPPGGFKDVCHVRQELAQRAVCTAIFREKMLKFTDSRTTSVRRARSCRWRNFWG